MLALLVEIDQKSPTLRKWHKNGRNSSKGGTKASNNIRKCATKNGHKNSPILPEMTAGKNGNFNDRF
jgi:hypothetical protein